MNHFGRITWCGIESEWEWSEWWVCLVELGCEHWYREIVEWFRGEEVGCEGGDRIESVFECVGDCSIVYLTAIVCVGRAYSQNEVWKYVRLSESTILFCEVLVVYEVWF